VEQCSFFETSVSVILFSKEESVHRMLWFKQGTRSGVVAR